MGNIGPQRRRLELLSERASDTTTPAVPAEHAMVERAGGEHTMAEHTVAEHTVSGHAAAEHPRPTAPAR